MFRGSCKSAGRWHPMPGASDSHRLGVTGSFEPPNLGDGNI